MNVTAEQVEAGQAVYSKRTLAAYDFVVLGVSNRFIWKCPTQRLEEHYNQHIALMDLNPDTLEFASKRIARYKPKTFRRNVLEPISTDGERFDSVGVNYLLHCIPGSMESKAVAFDHLKTLLNPNGVLFWATLLQGGVTRNWFAKRLMAVYNKKGVFSNEQDNLEELTRTLKQRFRDVSVEVVGCTAMFSGRT